LTGSPDLHLSGMGVLGSLTALRLEAAGVPFTWDDPDAQVTAWRASTGLIYPTGDDHSLTNLAAWRRWADEGWLPDRVLESVTFAYPQRAAPHGGRYPTYRVGPLTCADAPAFVLDTRALVLHTRERFAGRRRDDCPPGRRRVISHGFSRAEAFMWGWSAVARLRLHPDLAALPARPVLYGRRIHVSRYAYPAPGRDRTRYLIGSASVQQRVPKRLDLTKHLTGWIADLPAVFGDAAHLVDVGELRQGWRPRPVDGADPVPVVDRSRPVPVVRYPALRHSGVRWAPTAVETGIQLALREDTWSRPRAPASALSPSP
jgi:hypothetical protein